MTRTELYHSVGRALSSVHSTYAQIMWDQSKVKISLSWLPTEKFSAYVDSKAANNEFDICISDGVFEDLCTAAERSFDSPVNNMLVEEYRDKLISAGMHNPLMHDREVYIERFVKITIVWVYFHELGHIAQDHMNVGKSFGCIESGWDKSLEQISVCDGNAVDSSEGALKHIFEISADSEATMHVINFLVTTNKYKQVIITDIWFFFAGITSLFAHFYKDALVKIKRVASGTHPSAVFRLRLILSKTIQCCVDLQKTHQVLPWVNDEDSVWDVAKAAFASAALNVLYYNKDFDHKAFRQAVLELPIETDSYATIIFNKYLELRPALLAAYKGVSTEGIIELISAEGL